MSVTAAPSSPSPAAPPAPAPAIAPAAAPPPPAPLPRLPFRRRPRAEQARGREAAASPTFSRLPMKPVKPTVVEEEQVYPDAGDVVEHFAFGRCEVVKSDGDVPTSGSARTAASREVALEMLKVTPLPGRGRERQALQARSPDVALALSSSRSTSASC